ncbi:class I SAM-dependent DNA methyltransferase [Nocardia salmonicida]|uniref:class I SAM-dependent DNA methyltransferase n=1 Tax=Nocardia salmonicida TaxID=53431 RepID=UPI002E2A9905|nr:SAM-dependent methyltransferase [Nocardia salmonicida]
MSETSMPPGYFDRMYAHDDDPWRFTTRWYEQRKRALTMAMLPKAHYRRGFEPGCSIGVLTEELAGRCDHLVGTDIAERALDAARSRLVDAPVEFRLWGLGQPWEAEDFDLIVLSEVCYYLDAASLRDVVEQAVTHLEPGGTLLCAHWRHVVADYPLTGDDVHAIAHQTAGLSASAHYEDEDMLIDVFAASTRIPPSVAEVEGLV